MTHAFFKALMFLGAGSVIHGMHHEQDMRRMGGLRKYMPYTYLTFLAGWLAICGIIPFSGFWSKDEILWSAASTRYVPVGWIVWIVGTIAATCTAFYMTRLMAHDLLGQGAISRQSARSHAGHEVHDKDHDTPTHHAHIPHESPRFNVGAAGGAGRVGDDWRLCRNQSGVHRWPSRRRPDEHRQLPRSDHLESDDAILWHA